MIVKNGEILAIDHIAHDNTLSGNGTSAKPVGLSQSTKNLIDSKVEKTDFETYKSSAANQISNINTKITTDESNFESYKSSAHNEIANFKSSAHDEIARVDGRIDAVNAAKVDKTTFTQYQTDVANNFTAVNKRINDVDTAKVSNTTFEQYQVDINNAFTAVDKRINDVDAAKQNKGDYVSASDFNTFKSSAYNEIARIDGRIDATNTNLENNYYDITETYNKTEVDKKFADFGGYKFRAADPENNNQPILNDGEEADPKAIYLTQPEDEEQYLQWVCDEEHIDPPLWKCIGDTTMDLKDYAKTVDVVASAEANKNWAERTFETQTEFSAVIKGYYTKDEVNTELATKVNNTNFNAYKTEVAGKFTNTSAWANETFATNQNLTETKAELEGTIESVSGEIISKVNTDYGTLDDKIDAITTTLSNDYYTSQDIDTMLAASGEYYTKSESDTKYAEKEVFNTAINELSSNKLDKSATANWDVTEYTEGENIKIVGHEISGKDWSNEIADAVENKVDKSELENYYTSSQIDGNFVTKTKFNELDNEVGAIDADLDILSGKTVTVIKDSETVKAIRSTEPDGTISYTLSAHDGKQADYLWKPTVNAAGDISWELALTGDTPDPANIKGPQGIQGISGTPGKDGEDGKDGITPKLKIDANDIWNVSYDNEETWTSLGVSATGPKGETGAQGPQGISGTPGKNGENGITPHIGNNNHWFIGDDDTGVSATGPQGDTGDDGVSPTVVLGEAVTSELHKNGGTTIKITDKTGDQTFTAWNGNDGTMAGAPGITGYDGITARNTGTTYEIGLSGEFYTAITSVSSKLDESDFTTYTETTAPNTFQLKGNYATTQDISDMATETWVGQQGFLTEIPSKYITETELSTALLGYLTKLSADDLYQPKGNYLTTVATSGSIIGTGLAANKIGLVTSAENALKDVANKANTADVYSKTDADDKFVTTANITTQDTDYVMTTSGWKVLSLPGGGMTQVTHDTTLTGQGNADDNKLGVAWSALSGNTIASALSAGSATVAANLGTSSFADITGAINAKADATAISDMLTKTVAEETYQTIAGMSNYLTTSDASTTYQTKGNYATTQDISDMATKTWVGQQGFLKNSDLTDYATKTYANEASANALTQAESWVETEGYIKSVPDISGNNGLSANGHTVGINNTGIDVNKQYAWTTTGWKEVQGGGGGGEINIIESIRLEGDTADVTIINKKATIPLATASATGVAGNTGVITKDDKAHLDAAVEYKENPYDSSSPKALVPQQMFVCESDQQIIDIVTNHTDLINGKGTIFFRITGI